MSNKPPRNQFEELFIPRKELPKLSGHYRVYKDAKDYIVVEAENALEALKKSGLSQVYRIVRDAIYLNNVLNLEALSNNPAPAAKTVEETPAAASASASPSPPAVEIQTPEPPAAAEIPAPETPLSTTDVDKLLKSDNATGA